METVPKNDARFQRFWKRFGVFFKNEEEAFSVLRAGLRYCHELLFLEKVKALDSSFPFREEVEKELKARENLLRVKLSDGVFLSEELKREILLFCFKERFYDFVWTAFRELIDESYSCRGCEYYGDCAIVSEVLENWMKGEGEGYVYWKGYVIKDILFLPLLCKKRKNGDDKEKDIEKEFLERAGYLEGKYLEDFELLLETLKETWQFEMDEQELLELLREVSVVMKRIVLIMKEKVKILKEGSLSDVIQYQAQ